MSQTDGRKAPTREALIFSSSGWLHNVRTLPLVPGAECVPDRNKIASAQFFNCAPHSAAGGYLMKKLVLAVAAVALMSSGAVAQSVTVTTGAARSAVQIEPETRTKIRTYVTEHKVRPLATRERIAVGATLPSDVELVPVPSEWGPSLTKYRYVYSNDRVMLVDPGNRIVVQEID
jgi:hypothetical protein